MPTVGFCSVQASYLHIPVIVTHLITTYNNTALPTTTLSGYCVQKFSGMSEF
jgi:hypothetical protein